MDLVYIGLTIGFFLVSWAFIVACEHLSQASAMTALYALGGFISLVLLVYLFVALLKPERF